MPMLSPVWPPSDRLTSRADSVVFIPTSRIRYDGQKMPRSVSRMLESCAGFSSQLPSRMLKSTVANACAQKVWRPIADEAAPPEIDTAVARFVLPLRADDVAAQPV